MRISNAMIAAAVVIVPLAAQDTKPSCNQCSASYISSEELQAYFKRAPSKVANSVSDQQVRAADVGKSNVDIGVVYRSGTQASGGFGRSSTVAWLRRRVELLDLPPVRDSAHYEPLRWS